MNANRGNSAKGSRGGNSGNPQFGTGPGKRGGGGRGGLGRGGHAGGGPACICYAHSTPMFLNRHDRFCVFCGAIQVNQNLYKTGRCTNEICRLLFPARGEPSQRRGWIRCRGCDAFSHRDFHFCQMCGVETKDGSAKNFLEMRRKLAERNTKLLETKKEPISMKRLGGDELLATPKKPKKQRKAEDISSDDESILSNMDLEGIEKAEEVKNKGNSEVDVVNDNSQDSQGQSQSTGGSLTQD